MFNLLTLHTGKRNSDYGFELGSFINNTYGTGLLVIVYNTRLKGMIVDVLYLSWVFRQFGLFKRWWYEE